MNIALFGYGKMGKEIEAIALQNNHNIVLKITNQNIHTLSADDLKKADVAIEFSTPQTVVANIKKCFDANLPVVVGTTGWYENFEEIKNKCAEKDGSLFYATNYSIGVNLFFKVNTYLAELMNKYNVYDVSMEEIQVFDPGYKSIRKFFRSAQQHLKPWGKLLIGFSSDMGNLDLLKKIASEYKFELIPKYQKFLNEKQK